MTTLVEIYQQIKHAFMQAGIDTPELDAKYLIKGVVGVSEEDFILRPDSVLNQEDVAVLEAYCNRRVDREPVAKILGFKEFWGRRFIVTKETLDPRPDSETLIQAVLNYIDKHQLRDEPINILDLGTGSGCLLITLLAECTQARGVGVDISEEALQIAQQNALVHKVDSRFLGKNNSWSEGIDLSEFDIIISNPPYIAESEIRNLSREVQNHDPILALNGGKNGLDCYKIIFNSIKNEKKFNGHAFFEIGFDQHSDIMRLVDDSMLRHCESNMDLNGQVRVVEICRGDK